MGLAESIESGIGDLLHARAYLFGGESVTLPQQMLVFTSAVDEDGSAVEIETMIGS